MSCTFSFNLGIMPNLVTVCLIGTRIVEMSTVFMAIKMPTGIYIVPPICLCALSCAILISILLHFEIPQAAAVQENTKQALRIWRLQTTIVTAKRQNHFRKILKKTWAMFFLFKFILFNENVWYNVLLWYDGTFRCKFFDIQSTW